MLRYVGLQTVRPWVCSMAYWEGGCSVGSMSPWDSARWVPETVLKQLWDVWGKVQVLRRPQGPHSQ